MDEETELFEVEAIVGKRIQQGILEYQVKWKDYSEAENTWEPAVNLMDCTDLIREFELTRRAPRRGSLSKDQVKEVSRFIVGDQGQVLAEVHWVQDLPPCAYSVEKLHEFCPRLMCDLYFKHLNFVVSRESN